MNIAKKLSYKSRFRYKMGCVIANGNEIMGLGVNNPYKTHPRSNNRVNTIHAELSAILNSRKEDLTNCTAYVYRESKEGFPAIAKPCIFCQDLLKQMGIKEVYFTDKEKGIKREIL